MDSPLAMKMTIASTNEIADLTIYVSHGAETHTVQARPGQRLMEAIRDAGLPIAADCGGCCTCATCHVYVSAADITRLPAPAANEAALLEVVDEWIPESRLSCQIELSESMNGLQIKLAPGSY